MWATTGILDTLPIKIDQNLIDYLSDFQLSCTMLDIQNSGST